MVEAAHAARVEKGMTLQNAMAEGGVVLQRAQGMSDLDASTPSDSRNELRQDVALMRELGVSEWKTIKLGTKPVDTTSTNEDTQPSRTPEEMHAQLRDARRRNARGMLSGPMKPLGSSNE